ncbi:MAG: hypothetical protein KY476_07135, partial [Planctomycetes bacterium]|nr:hypothetical protein [Planctomycetota bacterium]
VMRRALVSILTAGAALTYALVLACVLWSALAELGDDRGAAVARGALVGLAVLWAATLLGMIVVLAVVQIRSIGRPQP